MDENQKYQIFSAIGAAHGRIENGMALSIAFIGLGSEIGQILDDPDLILYDPN